MTVRRIVFLLFCLILIVGVVGAKGIKPKSAHMVGDIYQIPKTAVAPVIDGLQDDAWKTVGWNFQRLYTVDGTATLDSNLHEGMSKAMWDDTNLYFLFYSQDPIICDNPAQTAGWQKDGVELYIDPQNSKIPDNVSPDPGGGLPPTDIQLTIPHAYMGTEAANVGALGFPAAMSTAGVEFAITDDDNVAGLGGWWLELKIPLDNIDLPAVVGQQIGWEIQQDISDDNTARQWMTKWWSPSNNSWTDASLWGTAELVQQGGIDVGANMQVVKTASPIVIDGQLDAAYSAAIPQGMNYPRVDGGGTITDYMFDAYITTYTLWDDNNFYAFFNVTDNILCDNPAQTAGWQKDAVEVYFDPDNSKTPDNVSPDPGGGLAPTDIQLTIPHAFMGTEAANVGAIGFPAAMSTAGVEFVMVDHDMGYNLELKIPLENIDLPAVEGQLLGFEVQKDESDDNTARQSMEKWWSPSNNSWTDASLWGTAILGPVSGTVGIADQPKVANEFRLEQNYPNPFNPSTQITYSVPKTDKVKLTVYNVLGNQIATLVNQTQTTGTYTTTFSAKNLASGIYFYKLEVGSKMLAKKMMLLK